jgi:hypothetical protein
MAREFLAFVGEAVVDGSLALFPPLADQLVFHEDVQGPLRSGVVADVDDRRVVVKVCIQRVAVLFKDDQDL